MSFNKNLMISIYSRIYAFYLKSHNEKEEMAFLLWLEEEQEAMQLKYEKRKLKRLKKEIDDWLYYRERANRNNEDAPKPRTILLWILLIYLLLKGNNIKKCIEAERKILQENVPDFIDKQHYISYIFEYASIAAGFEIEQIHDGLIKSGFYDLNSNLHYSTVENRTFYRRTYNEIEITNSINQEDGGDAIKKSATKPAV